MKKVSILMPVYNSEKFIKRSISSVLNQSYKNWELIIVDDGSTDNSAKLIQTINSKKIKFFKNSKNLGQRKTRNILLKKASGDYIAYLDSDDYWNKYKLEKQIKFMQEKNLCFSYTNYLIKIKNKIFSRKIPNKVNFKTLLKENFIGQSTVVYEKRLKIYKFKHNERMDFSLWLEIIKETNFLYGITENLTTVSIRSESQSSNLFRNITYNWNSMRKTGKIKFVKSFYYLFYQIFRSLKKRNFYLF